MQQIYLYSAKIVFECFERTCENGVSVSTVGLSDADDTLMTMIADKTGGVYVKAEDVTTLEAAMNQAAVSHNTARNLLGYRSAFLPEWFTGSNENCIYSIAWSGDRSGKDYLAERFLDTSAVLMSSAIGSILAGICIEIGMNMLGVHPTIMRMITCVLIAFTVCVWIFAGSKKKIGRVEGFCMVALYAVYAVYIIIR